MRPTAVNVYIAALLTAGATMIVTGSLTLGSIGSIAVLTLGVAGVTAGLVVLGIRLGASARERARPDAAGCP